ncbi:unnamed protein product [Rhodiola kirilowii]
MANILVVLMILALQSRVARCRVF